MKKYPDRYFKEFDGTFTKSYTEQDWLDELKKVLDNSSGKVIAHVKDLIEKLPNEIQQYLSKIPAIRQKIVKTGVNAAKQFFSDTKTGNFLYRGLKRFLPKKIINAIETFQSKATGLKIKQSSNQLVQGKIGLVRWQRDMRQTLKNAHLRHAIMAKGGVNQMTPEDYLAVGRNLKQEYRYLRLFARDIRDGKVSEAQFMARSQMYAQKARSSGEIMRSRVAKQAGLQYMQRFLYGGDRSCPDCVKYAGQGKVLIGELPLPTEQCQCRANCKCRVEYL
jgi:hypothetical protein